MSNVLPSTATDVKMIYYLISMLISQTRFLLFITKGDISRAVGELT